MMSKIVKVSSLTLDYPHWGDVGYRLLLQKNCELSIGQGQKGQLQYMVIILQQPYEGNCEVTFSNEIYWQDKQFSINTTPGQ